MKRFSRLQSILVMLSLGIVGATYAAPDFAEDWGLDFWNYSQLEQECQECLRVDSRLSAGQDRARWRIEVRSNLVADLIDRRVTIDQTLRQFQELNGQFNPEAIRSLFETSDDRYVAARQLIRYLEGSGPAEARRREIKAEVERMIQSDAQNLH
jgi:hypothetical protein